VRSDETPRERAVRPDALRYGTYWLIIFAGILGLTYDQTSSLLLVMFIHGLLDMFLFAVLPVHGPLLWLDA
jgi:membrane protease YdiL (CAAX protease family)